MPLQKSTSTPPSVPMIAGTSFSRSQESCLDLQRPNIENLIGHRLEIFLDFLRAPSPSRESIATLSSPVRESTNLLTRSWNEKEKQFLAEMPAEKAIVLVQLHNHRSILYMMSVADKVVRSSSNTLKFLLSFYYSHSFSLLRSKPS